MRWRWVAVMLLALAIVASLAYGQQPSSSAVPSPTPQTENEISMRSADTAIKVRVNLVLVRAVVRDSGGKAIPGLKQDDFQVFDNGKRQKISSFNIDTPETEARAASATDVVTGGEEQKGESAAPLNASILPQRFLALVFDDSHLKTPDAIAVHEAARKLFVSLAPTDRVAIYSTQGDIQQDFTADPETLRKTVAAIVPHPAKGEGVHECPNITYYQADLIVNKHDPEAMSAAAVDADVNDCPTNILATSERILQQGDALTLESYQLMEEIANHLASMPGQRVLVYVSPGFILPDLIMQRGSGFIDRAIRAGVVVNTIDARGLYTAEVMPDIDAPPQESPRHPPPVDYQRIEGALRVQAQFQSGLVLGEMAASTGGRYFHNRNDLDKAMSQALAAPEVSYVLGFAPREPVADGKFHNLKVKLANGKKYQVEARNGYFAAKKLADPDEEAKQEVRDAIFSQDEIADMPVQLKAEFPKTGAGATQLAVLTHLDIKSIRFRQADGRNCNDLVLAVALFDTNGQLLDGQMKELALKLQDSTLEKMRQTGLTLKIVFAAKPGTYRVRSVMRGSEDDPLMARNLTAVVPGAQPRASAKNVSFQYMAWAPPNVNFPLKSLATTPPCALSDVLARAGASALDLAQNLEKFTAQEHIDYVTLDRNGMVEDYDSGSFQYVYSIEHQEGGGITREYRTPVKGSHVFPAIGQQIGGAAIALMFLPDLQTDYEMTCEGLDERNGQLNWVVHFQQRKDRPSRTAKFWVNNVSHPGMFEGRAWISKDSFQVVHLEASLMQGVPDIGLQHLSVSVDYRLVQSPSGSVTFRLPDKIATYWDYDPHRIILDHTLSDFQFFSVEIEERTHEPQKP